MSGVERPLIGGSTQRETMEPLGEAGSRSGFMTQVMSTVRRQLIQKRRSLVSTTVEMFLPLIFVLALALGSFAADTDKFPEAQFVAPGAPLNISAALRDSVVTMVTLPPE